jgi:hypothetical protein
MAVLKYYQPPIRIKCIFCKLNNKIIIDKQQGIRLLDENGSDDSENGSSNQQSHQPQNSQQYSIDQMLLRPARVWRPTARERRTGWAWSSVGSGAAGKRRKRLARLAALAGMVALGIGLLLLLWLAIMPTNRKELGLKNGGHKREMAENLTTGNIGISTMFPPLSSPPNSPSNGHKIDLNSSNNSASISPKIVSTTVGTSLLNISTASKPTLAQSNQQKFRLSIVQKNGKKQRPNMENNVIRVTAPAGRQIEFDRMVKIKNEEPKGNGSHIVRAQLEKGREWGILERQNETNLDQIQEENGSARIEKEMPRSNFSSTEKATGQLINTNMLRND